MFAAQWEPLVRLVFAIPQWYVIPVAEMTEYIWFLETEEWPRMAKALHCSTVPDCCCFYCAEDC